MPTFGIRLSWIDATALGLTKKILELPWRPEMETLEEFYKDFWAQIEVAAGAQEDFLEVVLFEKFAEIVEGTGAVEGLDPSPCKGTKGIRVDGYDLDEGDLILVVCEFRHGPELGSLQTKAIQQAFNRLENFFKRSLGREFHQGLDETSPGEGLAHLIWERKDFIKRVRMLLFSNARLASRLEGLENQTIEEKEVSYEVWDITRIQKIEASGTGREPVEIDFTRLNGKPLTCIRAHVDTDKYEAYLAVMPGDILCDIYENYGSRLLEQNVRTFLQARNKVNKGINATIRSAPEMFFAYNNGITATASSVETVKTDEGLGLSRITDLQVVNGAQTTASLLHARRRDDADLSTIAIQMKLSVLPDDKLDEVVPKISRFSNSQTKVSEADFFSNHEFHIRLEEMSRDTWAPPRQGAFSHTKWFYERARGQFANAQSHLSQKDKREFLATYPKNQMFTKTDVAKYEMLWQLAPHVVSKGAQKNFLEFATGLQARWDKDSEKYNKLYFRNLVAKAIIFRSVDRMVFSAEWYPSGYKANIVAYSVAWLIHHALTKWGKQIDLEKIWKFQDLPENLHSAFNAIGEAISKTITDTPDDVSNVTEYCKQERCWQRIKSLSIELEHTIKGDLVDMEEADNSSKNAVTEQKLDDQLNAEAKILLIGDGWSGIRDFAQAERFITFDQDDLVERVLRGNQPRGKRQIEKLAALLREAEERGYVLPDDVVRRLTGGETDPEKCPVRLGYTPNREALTLRKGPYGLYLQVGEKSETNKKPTRISIPKNMKPETIDLEVALAMLSLPRELGMHPDLEEPVMVKVGKYGFYIQCNDKNIPLKNMDMALNMTLSDAVEALEA
uniref:AIPR protein n=1 Tax=uncultured marine microorganism HF4000_APKG8K5 TaxID=455555 RepID=B3TB56_9ZZZZ|nr:hypothetical protein ALOHA_HF4000APKG8K5ctg1g34 [uncultured marine microorganism HF4000_APKG8K5]